MKRKRLTTSTPSSNGDNGRGANGRFVKGWKGGPGNPFAKRSAELKSLFDQATSDEDTRAVIRKLVEVALMGDVHAIRLYLDRKLGKLAIEFHNEASTMIPDERFV